MQQCCKCPLELFPLSFLVFQTHVCFKRKAYFITIKDNFDIKKSHQSAILLFHSVTIAVSMHPFTADRFPRKLWRVLNVSSNPTKALKSLAPQLLATSNAFSLIKGPETSGPSKSKPFVFDVMNRSIGDRKTFGNMQLLVELLIK